ncbi:MAG: hypothetical protein ABI165_03565 [Bryobacteraceae bacterium]
MRFQLVLALIVFCAAGCQAQVYSPTVLKAGQVDTTSLRALALDIYAQAGAHTERDKAEAIWRFFLTDGRFVKPGFWYHIAGWAYEEPDGEVLDPMKLLNSYGFGLCYHIAPLLSAVWDAGGFEHSRVWFLTGHTVAEVYYYGQYHYYDSDMMGYNAVGSGPLKERDVASVHQIERNGNIILGKLTAPGVTDKTAVDDPWYPADVRAKAIGGLAELFTTTNDNRLYAFTRYPRGHTMDFVLRPGERMIRYFRPETPDLYYLPYKFDGTSWHEFPQEIAQYHIRTADGPQSQKDSRRWATGRIEYQPTESDLAAIVQKDGSGSIIIPMPCPYVVIDAQFKMNASLASGGDSVSVDTSVDDGHTWTRGAAIHGPFQGRWNAAPAVIVKSEHGQLTAVSGSYGYWVRITAHRADGGKKFGVHEVGLITRFEVNPRSLPGVAPGHNQFLYRSTNTIRTELPVNVQRAAEAAGRQTNLAYVANDGQGYTINRSPQAGEMVLPLAAPDGAEIGGFDVGGRFLDLRDGLAPDKFTAEVRHVAPWPATDAAAPMADLSWSTKPEGPYRTLWTYDPKLNWPDGQPIDRTLRWPEVDHRVNEIPTGTRRVYIRYRIRGMALDKIRLAVSERARRSSSPLEITHAWIENGAHRKYVERAGASQTRLSYAVDIPANATVSNEALILECPAR